MLISLATPFSYDPSKGRLLLDIVTSATNGAPTGNLDGVAFPDSSTGTVAIVSGDPTQAMGSATLAGLVLGLVGGTQVSTSLSGTFGFLIHSSFSSASANGTGLAVLGLMNFDGAGNPGGTYIYEVDSNSAQVPKTTSGVLTGTYSSNPDGIGSVTMALDVGINLTLNTAIAENGQSLRLLATDYQFPSAACGCNVAGMVLSGIARSAPGGSLNGSYGFDLTILPNLNATTGVATYDGAGNVTISATFVSPSDTTGKPTPPFNFNLAGTYATNPDGTGTISLAAVLGVTYAQKYAFVISDKGAGLLLIQLDRAGNGVQFGTAGSSRTPRSAS